jgi:hypothetical protein
MDEIIQKEHPQIQIELENGDLASASDVMYIDDRFSFAGSLSTLQAKTDIMSAFSAITGLIVNTRKLKIHYHNFGREKFEQIADHDTVTVHDHLWQPTKVPILQKGTFKFTGIHHSICTNQQLSDQEAHQIVSSTLNLIISRPLPQQVKLLVGFTSTFARAVYRLVYSCNSYSRLQQYDQLFSQFAKKVSKCPTSFPSALLHISPDYCGAGLPLISSSVCKEKLAHLTRAGYSDDNVSASVRSLFCRVLRRYTIAPFNQHTKFPRIPDEVPSQYTYWASPVIFWLQSRGMSMY